MISLTQRLPTPSVFKNNGKIHIHIYVCMCIYKYMYKYSPHFPLVPLPVFFSFPSPPWPQTPSFHKINRSPPCLVRCCKTNPTFHFISFNLIPFHLSLCIPLWRHLTYAHTQTQNTFPLRLQFKFNFIRSSFLLFIFFSFFFVSVFTSPTNLYTTTPPPFPLLSSTNKWGGGGEGGKLKKKNTISLCINNINILMRNLSSLPILKITTSFSERRLKNTTTKTKQKERKKGGQQTNKQTQKKKRI